MIDYDLTQHPWGLEGPEGYPEGVLHLWADPNGGTRRQREYKWADQDGGQNRGPRIQIVEHAERLRARQIDADFLHRFTDCRRTEIEIGRLAPPAGKRDLPRPRVAGAYRAMDEERFDALVAVVQHHRDGGWDHSSFEWNLNGLVIAQLASRILHCIHPSLFPRPRSPKRRLLHPHRH